MPGQRHVYVVEDDEAVRSSARTLLEAQGYRVRDFPDAESFLAATDGSEADCIVLDHNLAGLSGLDLIERLRGRGVTTPVVVVSGNGRQLQARAEKLGVAAYLRKPLAADDLLDWLARIFSARN